MASVSIKDISDCDTQDLLAWVDSSIEEALHHAEITDELHSRYQKISGQVRSMRLILKKCTDLAVRRELTKSELAELMNIESGARWFAQEFIYFAANQSSTDE